MKGSLIPFVFLFCLLHSQSGFAYLTASLNFTALTLTIDHQPHELLFELDSEFQKGFSLYDVQLFKTGLYKEPFNPAYKRSNALQTSCFYFPSAFALPKVTLRLFVSLEKLAFMEKPPKSFEFSILFKDPSTNSLSSSQKLLVSLRNLIPTQHYNLHYPKTIAEGRKFYHFFNQSHIDRHLGYQKQRHFENRMLIASYPRTGTNLFRRTIENILDEFSSNFIGYTIDQVGGKMLDFINTAGEMRGPADYIRIITEHSLYWAVQDKTTINKIIVNMRNPLDMIDSRFQHNILSNAQRGKVSGEYWRSHAFKNELVSNKIASNAAISFQYESLMHSEFPILLSRFEDLMYNPVRTFCDALTYIESVPCDFSWKPKLLKYLEVNGYSSFYRTDFANTTIPEEPYPEIKKSKLFSTYDPSTIRSFYYFFIKTIHFCGYSHLYKDYLKEAEISEFEKQVKEYQGRTFKEKNKRSLELALQYKIPFQGKTIQSIIRYDPQYYNMVTLQKRNFFSSMKSETMDIIPKEGSSLRHNTDYITPQQEVKIPDFFYDEE